LFYTEVNRSHFFRIPHELSTPLRENTFEDVRNNTG
jgi:hypothetical protein